MLVKHIRLLEKLFYTGLIAVAVAVTALVAVNNAPNGVAQVSGVAVESTRDVNRMPVAPVEYTYQGQTRVELAPVKAVAGESVTITVTKTGEPTSRMWATMILFTFVTAVLSAMVVFAVIILFAEEYFDRLARRARYSKRQTTFVH